MNDVLHFDRSAKETAEAILPCEWEGYQSQQWCILTPEGVYIHHRGCPARYREAVAAKLIAYGNKKLEEAAEMEERIGGGSTAIRIRALKEKP